jgi:hypothetical protein
MLTLFLFTVKLCVLAQWPEVPLLATEDPTCAAKGATPVLAGHRGAVLGTKY